MIHRSRPSLFPSLSCHCSWTKWWLNVLHKQRFEMVEIEPYDCRKVVLRCSCSTICPWLYEFTWLHQSQFRLPFKCIHSYVIIIFQWGRQGKADTDWMVTGLALLEQLASKWPILTFLRRQNQLAMSDFIVCIIRLDINSHITTITNITDRLLQFWYDRTVDVSFWCRSNFQLRRH